MSLLKNIGKLTLGFTAGVSLFFAGQYSKEDAANVTNNRLFFVDTGFYKSNFISWFNQHRLLDRKTFPVGIDSSGFVAFCKHMHLVFDDSLTLQEFTALFFTVYNETGGKFKSLSEIGSDAYFFNEARLANGLWKRSYNTLPGNIPAGTYLQGKGILQEKDSLLIRKLNGTQYPEDISDTLKRHLRECDFYKLRGQGLIQITGRANFQRFVTPVIPNWDKLGYIALERELHKPENAYAIVRNYLKAGSKIYARLNNPLNPDFNAFGRLISGTKTYYLFEERCKRLYYALQSLITPE
jgi:hypothetical protein